MNRTNLWRFVIVLLVVLWSLYEVYPPTDRDLMLTFRETAHHAPGDTNFTAIVTKAMALQKQAPDKPYDNLKEAIGTNDIVHYF